MVIDSPNLKFLLFMEPTLEQKSKIPINDEITLLIRMASQDCITGTSNYDELGKQEAIFYRGKIYNNSKLGIPGIHKCCDGVESRNYDLLLKGDYITNTLCVHYVMNFRTAISKNDWDKIKDLQRIYGRSKAIEDKPSWLNKLY